MIKLYDYQEQGVHEIRTAMRREKRVLYQLPTGGGKTVVFTHIAQSAFAKGKRILVLVHRRELLMQASRQFSSMGIPHGLIASGRPLHVHNHVQIASVDTLIRRTNIDFQPDLIVIDEAHHVVPGNKWGSVMDRWPRAYILGVTATPRRLDGKALGDSFGELIIGPSTGELMSRGRLSRYKLISVKLISTEGAGIRAGEFIAKDIEEINDMRSVIGDTVETFKKHAVLPGLIFASSVSAAQRLSDELSANGYHSYCLHHKTKQEPRDAMIRGLETGHTDVITSYDTVSEGLDIPICRTAVLCHTSKSETKYLQQAGRALRVHPDKDETVFIDHGMNYLRHGLPDDDREWSLHGKKATPSEDEKALALRDCPVCLRVHKTAPRCPFCGHVYEVVPREEAETVGGELEVIDLEEQRRIRRQEQGLASTMAELINLGRSRGYKNPHGWAQHVMNARNKR